MIDFHFLRPYWLFALVPIVYLLWALRNAGSSHNPWRGICDEHLLPTLMNEQTNAQRRLSPWLLCALAWVLAVIALAGPTWSLQSLPNLRARANQILVLDLSSEMMMRDVQPSRLSRAKYKMLDLLNAHRDIQNALVTFTSEAFTVAPLTEDIRMIENLMPELSNDIMPVLGFDSENALKHVRTLIPKDEAAFTRIVLITANPVSQATIDYAKSLAHLGCKLSILDMNPTPNHTRIDTLKALAHNGQGVYAAFTDDDEDIKQLGDAFALTAHHYRKVEQSLTAHWLDRGNVLLWGLLPLSLLVFRRGWLETVSRQT